MYHLEAYVRGTTPRCQWYRSQYRFPPRAHVVTSLVINHKQPDSRANAQTLSHGSTLQNTHLLTTIWIIACIQ